MAACFCKASSLSLDEFWAAVSTRRAIAAYRSPSGRSFASAVDQRRARPARRLGAGALRVPAASGSSTRWSTCPSRCRPRSPGWSTRACTSKNGWLGQFLVPLGIQGAYSRLGIVLVLMFIGFPFVVRTLQPVLESLERDVEEAAACLGANRWQTFRRVILPTIAPALITGFALAVRPRARRVRLGRLRLGQHAVQDRDRAGADRRPPRGVRLRAKRRRSPSCCW